MSPLLSGVALAGPFAYEPGGGLLVTATELRSVCAAVAACTNDDTSVAATKAWCAAIPTGKWPEEIPTATILDEAVTCGGKPMVAPWSLLAGASLPSSAGIDQSSLLSGLSDFLVERARTELTTWVLSRVGNDLCDGGEAGVLLPETCTLLKGDARLVTTVGVELLQLAARRDVTTLPRRLAEHQYALPVGTIEEERAHALAMTAAVATRTVELVLDGASPTDALGAWSAAVPWSDYAETLKDNDFAAIPASLYVLSVVAGVSPVAQGRIVLADEPPDRIAGYTIGAALVSLETSGFFDTRAPSEETPSVLRVSYDAVMSALSDAEAAEVTLRTRLADDAGRLSVYGRYVASGVQPMSVALQAAGRLDPGLALQTANAPPAADEVIDAVSELAVASAALDWSRTAFVAISSFGAIDRPETICGGKGRDKSGREACERFADVVKGAALVGGLAEARNPAEARTAIEAIVAPVGAYGRKRQEGAGLYVTLNSYVGIGGGSEYVFGGKGTASGTWAPTTYPNVTLGPEIGGPVGRGWSFGIHLSPIDLGSLAAIRLDAGDTEASTVTVADVFAPGAWMVFGVPRAPFAFGPGVAFAPALRRDSTTGDALQSCRVGLLLAMDLTLLP